MGKKVSDRVVRRRAVECPASRPMTDRGQAQGHWGTMLVEWDEHGLWLAGSAAQMPGLSEPLSTRNQRLSSLGLTVTRWGPRSDHGGMGFMRTAPPASRAPSASRRVAPHGHTQGQFAPPRRRPSASRAYHARGPPHSGPTIYAQRVSGSRTRFHLRHGESAK